MVIIKNIQTSLVLGIDLPKKFSKERPLGINGLIVVNNEDIIFTRSIRTPGFLTALILTFEKNIYNC